MNRMVFVLGGGSLVLNLVLRSSRNICMDFVLCFYYFYCCYEGFNSWYLSYFPLFGAIFNIELLILTSVLGDRGNVVNMFEWLKYMYLARRFAGNALFTRFWLLHIGYLIVYNLFVFYHCLFLYHDLLLHFL